MGGRAERGFSSSLLKKSVTKLILRCESPRNAGNLGK